MIVSEYDIISSKISKSYTLVMLSDLHNREYDHIIEKVRDISPDAILVAGDLVDRHKKTYDKALPFLRECVSVAETFFSPGNHEVKFPAIGKSELIDTGANILDNSYALFGDSDEIAIGGQRPYASSDWLSVFEADNKSRMKILMDHHPEHYPKYLKKGHGDSLDLIVSAHAHGGQIRFKNRGVFSPDQGIFPKYVHGLYDGKLLVGAGLSNTGGIVPRWGNPTEIVKINLRKS